MSFSEDATGVRGETLSFSAKLEPTALVGLSLKNALLNIVTLTLYRFWAKTEVRRRIWNGVHLNGEPFEYTGRGMELFLGFLFAMLLIGLPFLLVVFVLQMMKPTILLLVIVPLYLGLFVLLGVARFRAFRYLASRTAWRGIRFQLKGSSGGYGMKYLGYLLLSGISFGWFWPAAQRRLAAPLWDGLRFGDRRVRFNIERARGEKIYPAFMLAAVLTAVIYFLWGGALVVLAPGLFTTGASREPSLSQIGMVYVLMIPLLLAILAVYAPYHAALLRSIAAGIRIDEAQIRLKLTWIDLFGLTLSNLALLAVTLGLLMPVVEARTARFLIRRLSAEGLVDLASAQQAPSGPRTGEGLADALGVITV